jgi:hypothetical protein
MDIHLQIMQSINSHESAGMSINRLFGNITGREYIGSYLSYSYKTYQNEKKFSRCIQPRLYHFAPRYRHYKFCSIPRLSLLWLMMIILTSCQWSLYRASWIAVKCHRTEKCCLHVDSILSRIIYCRWWNTYKSVIDRNLTNSYMMQMLIRFRSTTMHRNCCNCSN